MSASEQVKTRLPSNLHAAKARGYEIWEGMDAEELFVHTDEMVTACHTLTNIRQQEDRIDVANNPKLSGRVTAAIGRVPQRARVRERLGLGEALSFDEATERLVGEINRIGKNIYGLVIAAQAGELDLEKVRAFLKQYQNSSRLTLWMRHGAQDSAKSILEMEGASKKMTMMREPANIVDGTDNASLIQGAMLSLLFKAIGTFDIQSSRNGRALHTAAAINGGNMPETDERLDCGSYKSDEELDGVDLEGVLSGSGGAVYGENLGKLMEGEYERQVSGVAEMLADDADVDGDILRVGHTQSHHEILRRAGEDPVRLATCGFIATDDDGGLEIHNLFA